MLELDILSREYSAYADPLFLLIIYVKLKLPKSFKNVSLKVILLILDIFDFHPEINRGHKI